MTESKTVCLGDLEHDPIAVDGHEHRLTQLDDLLANLPHEGQLQSLRVRPFTGKAPKKGLAPLYWVTAGNRRLATLRKLRDTGGAVQGVIVTDDFPVHVIAGDSDDASAYATSRAENLQRLPETPVEEFRAFAKLAKTMPNKEIAVRFGITEKRVQQRLSLAALHPDVIAALEAGKITFEAAQAFTVGQDPAQQAAYLKKAPGQGSWQLQPGNIKSGLTEKLVRGDSDLAKLIGKKKYLAAGGQIHGDVFDEKSSYWISPKVIDKLVDAHWAEQVAAWLKEGWSFAERAEAFGVDQYGYLPGGRVVVRVSAETLPLDAEQQARIEAANARMVELQTAHPSLASDFDWDAFYEASAEDEEPDVPAEASEEYRDLEQEVSKIEREAPKAFTAEQKAIAGVVYFADGRRPPMVGVVRPGTKLPKSMAGDDTGPAKVVASLDAPGPNTSLDLSRRMTAALQAKVSTMPDLALRILVASLLSQTKTRYSRETPIKIMGSHIDADPNDYEGLNFDDALRQIDDKNVADLLADLSEFVARNIDVIDGHSGAGNGKQALIDLVDPRVPFDPDAYFAGVTKPLIQLAWRDMTSVLSGQGNLQDGKKGEMATKAANQARVTGWLPPQLRTPSYVGPDFATRKPAEEPLQQAAE